MNPIQKTIQILIFSAISQPQYETNCLYCSSNNHFIQGCPTYIVLSVQERIDFIKSISSCINCLRKGHTVSQLKLSHCRVCNQHHHTLLHKYTSPKDQKVNPPTPNHVLHASVSDDIIILATAVVKVKRRS